MGANVVDKIVVGIICTLLTLFATLALANQNSPSRTEVQTMIRESEARTFSAITEIKADQKSLLQFQQLLLGEVAKLGGQLERGKK